MSIPPAPDTHQATSSLIAEHINQEKCQSLFRNLPTSLLVSLVIALILSAGHWGVKGQAEIIGWNLLLIAVLAGRLVLLMLWHYTQTSHSLDVWVMLFRLGAWATGMVWGASVYFLFSDSSASHQALLAFSIAGVATGSLTSLTMDRWSAIGFVVFSVFPLSIKLYQQSGPAALPMFSMSLIFIFFVLASSSRSQRTLESQLVQNFELMQLTRELSKKQQMDDLIRRAQEKFIKNKNGLSALDFILEKLIALTASEMGFIGKAEIDGAHSPYMKALLFKGDSKHESLVNKYRINAMPENGIIANANGLIGAALASRKPVISHNLSRDMRVAGLPNGHPVINNFFAIPIFSGQDMIALLGLANTSRTYHEEQIDELHPLLNALVQFVQTASHEQDHARDKAALIEHSVNTQIILDNIADGIIMIDQKGLIQTFNKAAEVIFGYRKQHIIGKNLSLLMPEPYKSNHDGYIDAYLKTRKANILGRGREVIGLRKNGKSFPLDLIVSIIMVNNEPYFIGVVRDISDKQKNASSLAKTNAQLLDFINLSLSLSQKMQEQSTGKLELKLAQSLSLKSQQFIDNYFFNEKLLQNTKLNLGNLLESIGHKLCDQQGFNRHQLEIHIKDECYIEADPFLISLALRMLLANCLHYFNEGISVSLLDSQGNAKLLIRPHKPLQSQAFDIRKLVSFENPTSASSTAPDKAHNIEQLLELNSGKCKVEWENPYLPLTSVCFPLTLAN